MSDHVRAFSLVKWFVIIILLFICFLYVCVAFADTLCLPSSLISIEDEAFYGDTSLDEVVLPEGIKFIGERAFADSSVATIYLPSSINSIAENAFQNTSVIGTGLPGTFAHQWFSSHGFEYITETTPVEDFEWETINGIEAKITKYKGSDKRVFVPALIDDYDIVEVSAKAFYGNSTIESVTIPASVRTIKNEAFRNCSALQTVLLNEGLEVIGNSAFRNCDSLVSFTFPISVVELGSYTLADCDLISSTNYPINAATVGEGTFNNDPLMTSFRIEEGITIIHGRFFDNNKYLMNVQFPSTLQTIGPRSFYGCTGLTSITLPENTVTIGSYAFYGCIGIPSIIIPDSVTAINSHAFEKCSLLGSVVFSQQLVDIGANAFAECTLLVEANLPDTVVGLGEGAFRECTSLTTFRYPASLIRRNSQYDNGYLYDGNIFYNCKNLRTIVVPEGVTIIPSGLFMNANYIRTIELPSTLKEIHKAAFKNCISIRTINIPDGVEEIRAEAFSGCTALTAADLPDTITGLGEKAFYGCTALTSFHYPLSLDHVVSLYDNNNLYDGEIFRDCKKLSAITVPEGITTIPKYFFRGNNYLTSIILPSTLTLIDSHSFENCTALTNLSLPSGLLNVNAAAFGGCTLLQNADLPDSLVGLGERAFDGCTNLQSFHYPRSLIHLNSVYDNGHLYEGNVLRNCEKITSVEIPSGVTKIPDLMFQGCNYLQTVIVPDSVTAISDSKLFWNDGQAFKDCVALEKIYISPNVTSIGDDVFKGCTNLTVWCEYGSTILQYCKDNNVPYYYLTPTGINNPHGTLYKGDSYGLRGYAHASIEMTEITATIWDSTKENILQQITAVPEELDYAISGRINSNLHFGSLPLGSYHYTLIAKTALSEEQWADTSFTIVPPPLRIFIQNLSLPSGLIRAGESTSISGTIISNYSITSVTIKIIDNADGTITRTFNATPNQLEYALAAANASLNLSALPYSNYSIQIIAVSNGETKTLCSSDFDPVNYSGSIDDETISTLIAYAADGDHRNVFTKTYAEQVIDDMSWVEYGIVIVDNIANLNIFKAALKKLTGSGDQSDELVDLYKMEILTLLDDGAYDGATPIQSLKSDWKTILDSIKDGTSVYKELVMSDKMKFGLDICKSIVKGLKKGLDYGADIEEGINNLGACMSNAEEKLIILENLKQSAEFAGIPEFETAVDIVTEEYACWVNASLQELEDVFIDVVTDFSSEKLEDAFNMLYEFSHDGAKSSLSNFGKFQLGLKIGQRITGLGEEAQKFKSLFIQYNILDGGIKEYQAAFDIVHNGDTSTDAINRLYVAGNTAKSEWIRLHKTICSLPRYAYTIGNAALDYWDANLRNTMPFISNVSFGN